ncbi:histidine kinase [Actinotalea sp. K2]|uniref:ATP-binding protein n=1 Tax=Actinotalea sp. K2 TaxID=2939438 RepID=UPI002017E477|nr:histidine kinase [Actinotalea sp. K2]MCL3861321.1 histidine kinase [Actinotalea sp. K2]
MSTPPRQTEPPTAPGPFTELTTRNLGPVRRYFVRHPVAMDVVVMAWFGVPGLLSLLASPSDEPLRDTATTVIQALFVVLGTAALLWRRRRPLTVTAVITVLGVAVVATTGSLSGFELAAAFTVYAVAASRPARTAWITLMAVVLTLGVAVTIWENPLDTSGSVMVGQEEQFTPDARLAAVTSLVIVVLAAIAIGISVRNRRLHVADLVERANALARDRDQQTRLARAAERTRIAREMHDVVAHSLSVMIALADGAGAALERAPDRSRAALDELSETGRSALADMRRVLGVLHEPDAPLGPQPGSPDLEELIERFRTAGLPVRSTVVGDPLPDDAGLQLATYRLIQESLTNVLRHAPGAGSVEVRVSTVPGQVEIDVTDSGASLPVPDAGGAGHGLIGMRERAAVYGGTVDAGPHDHGWRMHAVLPWTQETT